ncbi:unnamed protein product [Brachionus calyciflorus]|uniref:ATP-dependent DNA helicase n=1 Tax=Brachionus calyciflorus TaxID=104777 RepID=A0A814IB58_9BILA|nr:unnamed protein product [Brachionus calyciflorus]
MQIILDKSAAINYMVKYATKGEKAGLALCQLFKDKDYTEQQLKLIESSWINDQKKIQLDDSDDLNDIKNVNEHDLNQDQKLVYKIVEDYENKKKQLLLIVNGTTGTGKSFTINAISKLLKLKLKRLAQTAKAAFLIKGLTLHSLFEIRQIRKKEVYSPLNGKKLKELQRNFKGITHIIIDEYSLLSQAVLGIIDKRLREATGKQSEYFGDVSILLTGDPGQLLKVMGAPLYNFPPKDQISTHGYDCFQ